MALFTGAAMRARAHAAGVAIARRGAPEQVLFAALFEIVWHCLGSAAPISAVRALPLALP